MAPLRAISGLPRWLGQYFRATGFTAAASAVVALLDLALSFPPFSLLAISIGASGLLFGFGPGLVQIAIGALSSDFLFLEPRYELTLNRATAGLAALYTMCALGSRIVAYWAGGRSAQK